MSEVHGKNRRLILGSVLAAMAIKPTPAQSLVISRKEKKVFNKFDQQRLEKAELKRQMRNAKRAKLLK